MVKTATLGSSIPKCTSEPSSSGLPRSLEAISSILGIVKSKILVTTLFGLFSVVVDFPDLFSNQPWSVIPHSLFHDEILNHALLFCFEHSIPSLKGTFGRFMQRVALLIIDFEALEARCKTGGECRGKNGDIPVQCRISLKHGPSSDCQTWVPRGTDILR